MYKIRILLYFLIFIAYELNAFSLTINNGKEDGNAYYVIHLENDRPFSCKVKVGDNYYPPDTRHDGPDSHIDRQYHCFIPGDFKDRPQNQKLPFMDLEFSLDTDGYWIIIKPKILSRIFSIDGHLYSSNDTKQGDGSSSRHYTIIINEKLSYSLAKTRPELDFPIIFPDLILPHVGGLDFNKEPLSVGKEDDINDYISIKRLYDANNYIEALKLSKAAMQNYPNSVFMGEFGLHYLRSLNAAKNDDEASKELENMQIDVNEELITFSKAWAKNHASDISYPEVLYMLMQAYLDNDNIGDGEYTMDLLMTEHTSSPWTKKAVLSYADFMLNAKRPSDAVLLYEDVLYSTTDIEVASLAAMRLATTHIKLNRPERAASYLQKILDANPSFLATHKSQAMSLAAQFKENKYFQSANKIYEIILQASGPKEEIYEQVLRSLALSPADDENSEQIYSYLQTYQKTFPNSEYISLINTAIDRLFFNIDQNQSKEALQSAYAQLMHKYKGSEIGNRALFESISLSYKEGDYKSILNMRDDIRDSNDTASHDILQNAASALANDANQHKACARLMLLLDEFNVTNNIKDKYKLFACYIDRAHYKEALALTTNGIQSGDLRTRIEWLSNASQALFNLGLYSDALKAANDAIYESKRLEYSDASRAIYYRFFSLLRLNRLQDALTSIDDITKLKGTDFMYIQMCDAAATYAAANNLDASAIKYAKKVLEAQSRLKISTFSPQIDFIYIDTLKKLNLNKEALQASAQLLNLELKDDAKARALYTLADLQLKVGAFVSAKQNINKCIELKNTSAWQGLCRQQLELINTNF